MRPKILFVASIPLHIRAFHLPYLKWFQEQGYETHVAVNGYEKLDYTDKIWQVDFVRSPFSIQHIKAYRQLNKLINQEDFVLINCHTPMASVLTRLASIRKRKTGTQLIYTAHGFHFFKGSPKFYWYSYYPVEKFLSKYTDAIVTINFEDFECIKSKGSSKCNYYLIPGIGVERKKFFPVDALKKNQFRIDKSISKDAFIIVYAAEFIYRKNHQFIIDSIYLNKEQFTGVEILFAGKGELETQLIEEVETKGLTKIIKFIGFRTDINEIYQLADLGISSSRQEGLGLNLVEEMMCGLPIIATEDRGHKEVIKHGKCGFLFEQNNSKQFVEYILLLKNDSVMYNHFSDFSIEYSRKFEIRNSLNVLSKIFLKYLSK